MQEESSKNHINVPRSVAINEIYCLKNKKHSSIKNIISGFNQMEKLNLIDTNNLSESMINPVNYEKTMNDVRHHIKTHNKNKSWPSFLNDIRTAVIQAGTLDVTNMSFSETLFVFGQRKYGRITKTELARKISSIDKKFTHTSVYNWIKGTRRPTSYSTIDLIKITLDKSLDANGEIGKKVFYPNQKDINNNRNTFKKHIKLSKSYISEVNDFFAYKLDNILPKFEKPFENTIQDLRIKRTLFSSPDKGHSWTRSTDDIFKGEESRKYQFSFFFNSLINFYNEAPENISISDLLNDKALTEMTNKAISGEISKNLALKVLYLAKSECNIKSYISQYYPDTNTYKSFEEWKTHIDLLYGEIKTNISNIQKVKPDENGTKNITFILSREYKHQLKTHNLIIDNISQYASIFELWTMDSLYSHAAAAMYHIGVFGCPLRCDNFCSLKWNGDISKENEYLITESNNTAAIYRVNGTYKIFISKGLLKNRKNKEVTNICRLIGYAEETIDNYLKSRSAYLNAKNKTSDYFFIGSKSCDRIPRAHLTNLFTNKTLRAIRNLDPDMSHKNGINPHALRHLSATIYLAMHKDDYTGLSTLLMDSLETVLKVYAKNDHHGNSIKISEWGMSLRDSNHD